VKRGDIGSLVYLKGNSSTDLQGVPLVLVERYRTDFSMMEYFIVVDPRNGTRYEYQWHDLVWG
jgi:hypothetical protein